GGRQRDASGGGRRRSPARSPVMTAAPESDPGRLLRPFVLTSGGVDDTVPVLDLASMVVAVRSPGDGAEVDPERAAVLRLCVTPPSLARLLVSGVVAEGALGVGAPPDSHPTDAMLHAVLEGLRAL